MTEPTREERRTAKLRQVLPLYNFIELSVDSLEESAQCSVPLSAANTNHIGIMHAGVLFALAEAAGGQAISIHRDLARHAVIAKHVEISYRRPATTKIRALATLSLAAADAVRARMADNPKYAFDISVVLQDEQDKIVADSVCTFVLLKGN